MKKIIFLSFLLLILTGCAKRTTCICDDSDLKVTLKYEIKHNGENITDYKENYCQEFESISDAIAEENDVKKKANAHEYIITRSNKTLCLKKHTQKYQGNYSNVIKNLERICKCNEK